MALPKIEQNRMGDLLVWETDPNYTREGVALQNSSAGELNTDVIVGMPVKELTPGVWAPVLAADEANVGGLVLSGPDVVGLGAGADTKTEYAVLAKGPALIKDDGITPNDIDGGALNLATLKTALAVLGIDTLSVPPITDVQPT